MSRKDEDSLNLGPSEPIKGHCPSSYICSAGTSDMPPTQPQCPHDRLHRVLLECTTINCKWADQAGFEVRCVPWE